MFRLGNSEDSDIWVGKCLGNSEDPGFCLKTQMVESFLYIAEEALNQLRALRALQVYYQKRPKDN